MILASIAVLGKFNQERWVAYKRSTKAVDVSKSQMPQLFSVSLEDMGDNLMMHVPCSDDERVDWMGRFFANQHDNLLYKSPLFRSVRARDLLGGGTTSPSCNLQRVACTL